MIWSWLPDVWSAILIPSSSSLKSDRIIKVSLWKSLSLQSPQHIQSKSLEVKDMLGPVRVWALDDGTHGTGER